MGEGARARRSRSSVPEYRLALTRVRSSRVCAKPTRVFASEGLRPRELTLTSEDYYFPAQGELALTVEGGSICEGRREEIEIGRF